MTPIELAFRVGVAVVVILAPTVMFLGFWRLLMRMRNGELVERVMQDDRVVGEWSSDEFAQPGIVGMLRPAGSSAGQCPHCGQTNPEEAAYCAGCLERL